MHGAADAVNAQVQRVETALRKWQELFSSGDEAAKLAWKGLEAEFETLSEVGSRQLEERELQRWRELAACAGERRDEMWRVFEEARAAAAMPRHSPPPEPWKTLEEIEEEYGPRRR